ncbi:MAG: single-stranded-DNA-specific exonuclease RecJ [Lachnospiraceae bacterium]|jgi:single-stranded-DNA-specific exonuclease|nr:single-stranded-DNA-specific exonuclease RecJ [Lachnospiraceae bacterium]
MEKWIVRGGRSLPYIEKYQLSPLLARILAARVTLEEVPAYLDRSAPLASPWLLLDMEKAVGMIQKHLVAGSRIRIVGDYDVDGLTSTAILYLGLTALGRKAEISCRIPERIGEGYGFSRSIAEEAIRDGVELVITCDNGIREKESASYLAEQGAELIITDHHEIERIDEKDVLPIAGAVINPHRQGDGSPQTLICGAFVAYQLMRALYEKENKQLPEVLKGYAALGTVCDVMPLVEENRKLVYQGFEILNQQPSTGIEALMQAGSVKEITPYTAGYVIGPMLNAGGRLGSQNRFLEILVSQDEKRCRLLAKELFDLNRERQHLTEEGIQQGICQVEGTLDMVKVVYLPQLHESIAGLVAGKLKERYQRPVFVLTKAERGLKGSGRSIPAYSMFQAMNQIAESFSKFGGHAMAAGLSLDAEEGKEEEVVQALRFALNQRAELTEEDCQPTVYIDAVMPMQQLSVRLVQELELLAPYGTGNARPMLAQKQLLLKRCQIFGKKRNVVRLTLSAEGQAVEAVCFDVPAVMELIRQHSGEKVVLEANDGKYLSTPFAVDLVYQAEIDMYTGMPRVKICIQHLRAANL